MLSKLPIAIDAAGVTLRELRVNCFPLRSSQLGLFADDRETCVRNLAQSCRNLKVFRFGRMGIAPTGCFVDRSASGDDERACVNDYLGAALSGTCLQSLHFDFERLGPYGRLQQIMTNTYTITVEPRPTQA